MSRVLPPIEFGSGLTDREKAGAKLVLATAEVFAEAELGCFRKAWGLPSGRTSLRDGVSDAAVEELINAGLEFAFPDLYGSAAHS